MIAAPPDRLVTLEAVRSAGVLLWQPGQVVELRVLVDNRRTDSGYFDSPDALANAVAASSYNGRAPGIYWTINPAKPALFARARNRIQYWAKLTTSDNDIERRRWLPLDFDPVRPAGVSSTDAEHELAFQRASETRDWLRSQGWPEPVLIDSGNGAHLLYRIDLPNDGASRDRIKGCLEALALRYSDSVVSVDTAIYNAARILKVPGTLACKGDNAPERPHRQSAVLEAPQAIEVVSPALLEALAARVPKPAPLPQHRSKGRPFDLEQWIVEYGVDVRRTGAFPGGTKYQIVCPFDPNHGDDAYLLLFASGAVAAGCFHNTCAGRGWAEFREHFEPEAGRKRQRRQRDALPSGAGPVTAGDLRPHLEVSERDLVETRKEAWGAVVAANQPIPRLFRFGGVPARLTRDDTDRPVLAALTVDQMVHELANAALWVQIVKTNDGDEIEIPKHPPQAVAHDLLADPAPPLPNVVRIVQTPVFAPDGGIQTAPGYHAGSRTYFDAPNGFALPDPPDAPSPDDIAAARALLVDELLGDFPFAEQADRANACAALLLPFVRDFIDGPTPLHMIEAPTPGSGKGLLVDVAARVQTGRGPAIMTAAGDDEEWRKRITTVLRNAPSVVLIDNITRPLDSGQLAAALTAGTWDDRLLGGNTLLHVPVRCAWLATANNPTVSTEIARRSVRIRLLPPVDRPWERKAEEFRHPHLGGWAAEHRAELVHACLVLGRAWLAAGKPLGDATLGSYEHYAAVMGGILDTAGVPGFLANRQAFYDAADLEGNIWRAFVAAWWEQHQDRQVGVADLLPIAVTIDGLTLGKSDSARAQQTALGMALTRMRDRVLGDCRIVKAGTYQRATRWRLLPANADLVNLVNLCEPSQPILTRAPARAPTCIHAPAGAGAHGDRPQRFTQVHKVHKIHADDALGPTNLASPDASNGRSPRRDVPWEPRGAAWERVPADTAEVRYVCANGLEYRINANAGTREARKPASAEKMCPCCGGPTALPGAWCDGCLEAAAADGGAA